MPATQRAGPRDGGKAGISSLAEFWLRGMGRKRLSCDKDLLIPAMSKTQFNVIKTTIISLNLCITVITKCAIPI